MKKYLLLIWWGDWPEDYNDYKSSKGWVFLEAANDEEAIHNALLYMDEHGPGDEVFNGVCDHFDELGNLSLYPIGDDLGERVELVSKARVEKAKKAKIAAEAERREAAERAEYLKLKQKFESS